jgi:hypothetical protein
LVTSLPHIVVSRHHCWAESISLALPPVAKCAHANVPFATCSLRPPIANVPHVNVPARNPFISPAHCQCARLPHVCLPAHADALACRRSLACLLLMHLLPTRLTCRHCQRAHATVPARNPFFPLACCKCAPCQCARSQPVRSARRCQCARSPPVCLPAHAGALASRRSLCPPLLPMCQFACPLPFARLCRRQFARSPPVLRPFALQ